MTRQWASQDFERELCGVHGLVAGMDEVGRGALAGPVTVGVAFVDASVGDSPQGLGDSKLLSPARRETLCEPIRAWAVATGIGHASPKEIDRWGIVGALRVAGQRALVEACGGDPTRLPSVIVLDGRHDWFSEPPTDLFSELDGGDRAVDEQWDQGGFIAPAVVMEVKADMKHSVVAAASNIAKVERDALMTRYDDPGYGWSKNKGYASASHVAALASLGSSVHHRLSWKLPGVGQSVKGTDQ